MCCLKYENDLYQEFKKGMPNQGEIIDTPNGRGKVMEANILLNSIKVRLLEEEKTPDSQEKLSTDVYVFEKKQIKRLKKPGQGKKPAASESFDQEIKEALAEELIDILTE
jgi:cell fate regulator YaaT (PSP1 superfamily)